MSDGNKKTYLGDGVYAEFDGFAVWLSTSRVGGEHRIALEPLVYDALVAYVKRLDEMPDDE